MVVSATAYAQASHHQRYVVARSTAAPWDKGPVTTPPNPAPGAAEQQSTDQADPVDADQTHVIYFVPKDKPNQDLDALGGPIRDSLRSIRAWFSAQTAPNAKRPRFDMTSTGQFDITFVQGQQNADQYTTLDSIRNEIQPNFKAPNKRYMIFAAVDRGATCGEGYFPIPPVYDQGQYSAVYLDSSGCHMRDFGDGTIAGSGRADRVAIHEWLHNEGIVAPDAPHHCASNPNHVCTGPLWVMDGLDPEQADLMFPYVSGGLKDAVLDIDHDDYLDTPWPWITNLRDSPFLEDG